MPAGQYFCRRPFIGFAEYSSVCMFADYLYIYYIYVYVYGGHNININRTSCAQVHELQQSRCGDSQEGT